MLNKALQTAKAAPDPTTAEPQMNPWVKYKSYCTPETAYCVSVHFKSYIVHLGVDIRLGKVLRESTGQKKNAQEYFSSAAVLANARMRVLTKKDFNQESLYLFPGLDGKAPH